MNNQMHGVMVEAMRLTQEGRLEEATAAIQRALGGGMPGGMNGAIHEVVDDVSQRPAGTAEASQAASTGGALRPAPRPARGFRGIPSVPEGLLDGLPGGRPGGLPGGPFLPADGTPATEVVPDGARFVHRSHTGPAGTRAYKLYVPSGYVVGQAVPLVVMLHGCTQNPDDFAAGTRMNELAERETFLVAYPAQSRGDNMQSCWNWFSGNDQRRDRGEPSIIAGIAREVAAEYGAAEDRVYVAGMSAGGAMAAIMGEAYPELFAAVGVHSGLAPGAARDLPSAFGAMQNGSPGRPVAGKSGSTVPLIVFHGDRDGTVNPRNAEYLVDHFLDARRGRQARAAATSRGSSDGGHSHTRTVYHGRDGEVFAERWTVHGLGHAWSGGDRKGSYTDPKGPDASAEMMRFFAEHAERQGRSKPKA